jgi:hypothetical protein
MPLHPIDEQHFYLDGKLIDLVWINHNAKKQTNAANYHEISRSLRWLNKLAARLVAGDVAGEDEQFARKRLAILGLDWYLDAKNG